MVMLMTDRKTVVIVEDDYLIAEYIRAVCEVIGVDVIGMADNAADAEKRVDERQPEYVLMDVRLRGRQVGVDASLAIHEKFPEIKIIFVTGSDEPRTINRIHLDAPYKILIKPVEMADLQGALDVATA